MSRVQCTAPWWHDKTYYREGAELNVPEGDPIPAGFIVDGVRTPRRRAKTEEAQARLLEEMLAENKRLRAQVEARDRVDAVTKVGRASTETDAVEVEKSVFGKKASEKR